MVATVAVATFLPAIHNEFLGDDVVLLEERLDEEHAASLRQLLLDGHWGDLHRSGLYRPLSLAFLAIQRSAFGLNPAPYRSVNLVLHALCAMLVFRLLARLLPSAGAFAGALVFAAHPIHAEAVGTIYGQQDLLAALFFLAAAAAGGASAFSALSPRTLVVGSFYLLSLLSKEQGLLLPLLLPMLRRSERDPARCRLTASDLAMAVPLGLYLVLRVQALGGEAVPTGEASVAHGYPWWARVNLAIVTVGTYLRLLVLPWGQTTHYGHLRDSLFGLPVFEFIAVVAGVLLFGVLQRPLGRRVVEQAYTILVITLLPVANLLPIGTVVAERCLYLPALAVCLLAGAGYVRAARRTRAAPAALCCAVLLGMLLSARVAVRWSSALVHWETTASDHPRSAGAHARVALFLLQESLRTPDGWDAADLARAEAATDRALAINHRLPEAWHARGALALARGDCAAAVPALERALALRPTDRQIAGLLSRCR